MRTRSAITLALAVVMALPVAGCGGATDGNGTVKLAYWRQAGQNRELDKYLEDMKSRFEQSTPGTKVELVPVQAAESDYHTKIELMFRSPNTAPDLVYEDSFRVNADVAAGHLRSLNDQVNAWPDWQLFHQNTRQAVTAQDGKVYAVPIGTDTRALWYDRTVFAKAGLPADWQPKTWDDVLAAARTIKQKVPDVVPMHVQTGKANGEGATMQGLEMLLYGTKDRLYDEAAGKWVTGSKGFRDSLEFVRTVYQEGLGPKVSDALSPTIENSVNIDWFPAHKIGIALNGSWLKYPWRTGGTKEWPDWEQHIGVAAMPAQDATSEGTGEGKVTMSGGWTWAIAEKAKNPDGAWKLLTFMQTTENATTMNTVQSTLAVRKDVAADPKYTAQGKVHGYFTDLVRISAFRPALPVYPRVSTLIQEAMESVTTGAATPEQAAETYDKALPSAVNGAVTNR